MRKHIAQSNPTPTGYGLAEAFVLGGKNVHDYLAACIAVAVEQLWSLRQLAPFVLAVITSAVVYSQSKVGDPSDPLVWIVLAQLVTAAYYGRKIYVNNET